MDSAARLDPAPSDVAPVGIAGHDVAVVPSAYYGDRHPSDALLVIEVSVPSLRKDLGVKAGIDARAGVPEYWVVDPAHRLVHVHTEPAQGGYRSVVRHGDHAVLDAVGVPVAVAEVLPRR